MRRYGLVDIPDIPSDIDAVPITRTITINGVTYDLSSDRTWTISVSSINIYNSDGTLTGNRFVTMNAYSLSFENDIYINSVRVGRGISSSNPQLNTLIGNLAFNSNVSGFSNTAVGYSAMSASQYGNANSAFGAFALYNLNGTSVATQTNTAIGRSALLNLTVGQSNTAVGSNAFNSLSTGDYNTCIGQQAGISITSASFNIVVGASVGSPSLGITTGSYNTIIGSQITGLATTLANNIILADGQGNIRIRAFDTGNVTVNSNSDGGYKFDVVGTTRISGITTLSNLGGTGTRMVVADATGILSTQTIPSGGGGMAIGGSITSATAGSVLFAGVGGILQQDNANFFWDDSNNRLGLGTATPSYILDAVGIVRIQDNLFVSKNQNANLSFNISNTTNGIASQTYGQFTSDATAGECYIGKKSNTFTTSGIIASADMFIQNVTKGDISIFNSFASGKIKFAMGGSSTAQMTLTAAGRLLLGTTTESTFLLDVNGTARVQGSQVIFGTSGSSSILTFQHNSASERIRLYNGGAGVNHGIGINSSETQFFNPSAARFTFNGGGDLQTSGTNEWARITSSVVAIGTTSPNASARLQIDSTTKGFLPPRMTTTQKNAIATPAQGLMVFDTTLNKLCVYTTAWETITSV